MPLVLWSLESDVLTGYRWETFCAHGDYMQNIFEYLSVNENQGDIFQISPVFVPTESIYNTSSSDR